MSASPQRASIPLQVNSIDCVSGEYATHQNYAAGPKGIAAGPFADKSNLLRRSADTDGENEDLK